MQALFLELVRLSLTGSVFALAVMALRLLLRKAPKWLLCLLWGVVALRLICPVSMESRFSLMPDSLSSGQVLQDVGSGYVGEVDVLYESNAGYSAAVNAGRQPVYSGGSYYVVTEKNSLNPPKTVENTVYPILSWVWLAGMLGMLAYTAVSYLALKRKMKEATWLRENIWQCEQAESPFVLGIIQPRIYLPYQLGDSDAANVIAHERSHIRRKDHWWKPIGFALLSVHWFNPVMWVAYILLCRDIEAACDEKVIRHMEKEQVRAYSTALLHCSIHRRRIAACPLAFGETGVKERITRIMHYKKPGFWIVLAAVLVCAAVAVCFLTDPNVKTPKQILDPLSAEDVQWVQISIWEEEPSHISLDRTQILELMEILKGLDEQDFHPDRGTERDVSVMVYCGSTEILLHWDGEYTVFHFDSATAAALNSTHCRIKSETLNAFLARFSSAPEETAPAVVKWFDYAQDHSGMSYEDTLEIRLEEFPGVTFQYTPYEITAVQEGISTGLIAGMPIWNAYFTDLTGDGLPEICAQLSFGSGLIDNRVVVYDYAKSSSYTLENRGYYDYYLRLNHADSRLYVEKRTHGTQELVSYGKLLYQDGYLRWKVTDSPAQPCSPLVPGTTYVPYQCIYMNPLSSYAAMGGDSGCKYLIGENAFVIDYRSNVNFVSIQKNSIPVAKWEWQEFPYTDEEWAALYRPEGFNSIEKLSSHFTNIRYQPLTDTKFLLNLDGSIWLVELSPDTHVGTYIWSIYQLVPESSMGFAQWEFAPAVSSRLPVFRFGFEMPYTEIRASCTAGRLVPWDTPGSTASTVMDYKEGCALYWSPVNEDGSIASSAKILFSVMQGEVLIYQGNIYLEGGSPDGANRRYTASLVGAGMYLRQNPEQEGALISYASEDYRIPEIPYVTYSLTLPEIAALVKQQDTDSLIGMSKEAVHGYWGEPDAIVHGCGGADGRSFTGDIYHVPNSYESLVFGYDENGIVESVHIEYRNSGEEWGISLDVTFQSADAFDIVISHSTEAQTVDGSITASAEYEVLALHDGELISFGSYMRDVLGYDYAEPLMAWDSVLYSLAPDGELVIPGSLAPYGTLPVGQYVLRKPMQLTDSDGRTHTMDYFVEFAITD